MSKALYNSTVIPVIIGLIAEKYGMTEFEAMECFYTSETAKSLNDPETGLYGQSALYIFSVYIDEASRKSNKEMS